MGTNAGSRFRILNTLGSLTGLDLCMCFACKNLRFVLDLFEFAVGLTMELASMAAKFFGPAIDCAHQLLTFADCIELAAVPVAVTALVAIFVALFAAGHEGNRGADCVACLRDEAVFARLAVAHSRSARCTAGRGPSRAVGTGVGAADILPGTADGAQL